MKKSIFCSILLLTILSTTAFATKPPGHPVSDSESMISADSQQHSEPLVGKVLQTINSGGYSYVFLQKKSGGKIWVAIPESPVKVGDQLSFSPGNEMKNFESKTLKRTFDSIIFSGGIIATTKVASPAKSQGTATGATRTTTTKETKISVTKATGSNAVTVEEIFNNSAKLDKKKVVVRGKVVKVSAGIMGKNWIHIQDGTGSQTKSNYDLTFTTSSDLPNVGDVITVSGTLAKDRDFGAGYLYKVIVENATIKK